MCSKTTGGSVLKTEKSASVSYQLLYRFIGIFPDYARRIILLIRKNKYSEDVPEQMLHEQLPELLAKRPPIAVRRFCMGGLPVKRKDVTLESECQEAIDQIERMQYARNLRIEGYRTVLCYGAAFLGKDCLIRRTEEKEK